MNLKRYRWSAIEKRALDRNCFKEGLAPMRISAHRLLVAISFSAIFFAARPCRAQAVADLGVNDAEQNPASQTVLLEDQLLNGLRVVTPEQRQYVLQIVALVDQGKLPRAMVYAIYTWSLKRNPRVPFPYFQIGLRAVADRRGIVVP